MVCCHYQKDIAHSAAVIGKIQHIAAGLKKTKKIFTLPEVLCTTLSSHWLCTQTKKTNLLNFAEKEEPAKIRCKKKSNFCSSNLQ